MLNIAVPKDTSIAIIGDVHEHSEQFKKMLNKISPSWKMWLVSVGDIYDKGFGINVAEEITGELQELQNRRIGFAVRGNHELKQIRKNRRNLGAKLEWWKNQPLSLSFNFHNGARVTVLHAGITPRHTWKSLEQDVEVCYVRDVDEVGNMIPLVWKEVDGERILMKAKAGGESWHKKYDGRFGYVVSGHAAQKDGEAKFYNYSCNIDSAVYETGILTAQVFNDDGNRSELIKVNGTPKKPELNLGY